MSGNKSITHLLGWIWRAFMSRHLVFLKLLNEFLISACVVGERKMSSVYFSYLILLTEIN